VPALGLVEAICSGNAEEHCLINADGQWVGVFFDAWSVTGDRWQARNGLGSFEKRAVRRFPQWATTRWLGSCRALSGIDTPGAADRAGIARVGLPHQPRPRYAGQAAIAPLFVMTVYESGHPPSQWLCDLRTDRQEDMLPMSKNPATDYDKIASEYAFFEQHATEALEDARAYRADLATIHPTASQCDSSNTSAGDLSTCTSRS
jgi:hypothetical protein